MAIAVSGAGTAVARLREVRQHDIVVHCGGDDGDVVRRVLDEGHVARRLGGAAHAEAQVDGAAAHRRLAVGTGLEHGQRGAGVPEQQHVVALGRGEGVGAAAGQRRVRGDDRVAQHVKLHHAHHVGQAALAGVAARRGADGGGG
eukprot:2017949-Prymnesium_polylepis.1